MDYMRRQDVSLPTESEIVSQDIKDAKLTPETPIEEILGVWGENSAILLHQIRTAPNTVADTMSAPRGDLPDARAAEPRPVAKPGV